MKRIIQFLFIIFASLSIINSVHATVVVQGDSIIPTITFEGTVAPGAKTFDRAIGSLYVGLNVVATGSTFAISRINRYLGTAIPKAIGLANFPEIQTTMRFLSLATAEGAAASLLVGSTSVSAPNAVFAMTITGTAVIESDVLIDAAGATGQSIEALTANDKFIFTALAPNGGAFGAANSGIAVVRINRSNSTFSLGTLIQTDAELGTANPLAKKLDPTTPQIRLATNTADPVIANFATMYWDDALQRLYTGIQLAAANSLVSDGIKSVVVARVDTATGVLTLATAGIAPDATVNTMQNQIVVAKGNTTDVATLATRFLRVMHTSTGLSYLIVNGGNDVEANVGNKIFALPLIDNPADPATHGTLADKDLLTNGKFQTVPTVAADIATDVTITPGTGADNFALVGGSPLFPLTATNGISDIVVIGDTVYASSKTAADMENEAGIFYSQAMFDNAGKILRWTPWAKRAFPAQTKGSEIVPNIVNLFDVDAANGKIWAVTGDSIDGSTIETNSWDFGLTPSLAAELNKTLCEGCYSALDLHAFTRGLGIENPNRYALFGGGNKVAFARISVSQAVANPFNTITDGATTFQVTAPQLVTIDFSGPADFLITPLPDNAGCVTSLEYSQRLSTDGTQGYFFAGTANGLYVFSNNGIGFTLSLTVPAALNAAPFTTSGWSKAPNLFGSIIDVQSKGQQLYVITFLSTPQKPYACTLWRIPYQNSTGAMFDTANMVKLAETGIAPFENTSLFTGVQIIATGPLGPITAPTEGTKEQLILTTNTGVYKSDASQAAANSIITAADQTAANWLPIDTGFIYSGISGMDTTLPATVWPFSVRDAAGRRTFDRSSISQVSGNGDPAVIGGFNPANFNSNSSAPAFTTTPPIINFWSDGARRFFIINRTGDLPTQYRLMVLPFNTTEWGISSPSNVLLDPALQVTPVYYWVQQIGATGILMAGTDTGVVALE